MLQFNTLSFVHSIVLSHDFSTIFILVIVVVNFLDLRASPISIFNLTAKLKPTLQFLLRVKVVFFLLFFFLLILIILIILVIVVFIIIFDLIFLFALRNLLETVLLFTDFTCFLRILYFLWHLNDFITL